MQNTYKIIKNAEVKTLNYILLDNNLNRKICKRIEQQY